MVLWPKRRRMRDHTFNHPAPLPPGINPLEAWQRGAIPYNNEARIAFNRCLANINDDVMAARLYAQATITPAQQTYLAERQRLVDEQQPIFYKVVAQLSEAKRNAERLAYETLGHNAYLDLQADGYLPVDSNLFSGCVWRVGRYELSLHRNTNLIASICILPSSSFPSADALLSRYALCKSDEATVCKVGNWSWSADSPVEQKIWLRNR